MRFLHLLLLMFLPHFLGKQAGTPVPVPETVLHGLDVSHHQKSIEWDTVLANQRVDFAFVKATEGADFTDSMFCQNWEKLLQLGVRRGAYHFFRAYGCGDDQAQHFLGTVEHLPGDLAPVLDVERTDGIPPELFLEEIRVWLQTVERRLNCKPIIYTNQHFYERYLAGIFDNYPLWIAKVSEDRPILTTGKQWHFWQYSHTGKVAGIHSPVDLNLFEGSKALLDGFSIGQSALALPSAP